MPAVNGVLSSSATENMSVYYLPTDVNVLLDIKVSKMFFFFNTENSLSSHKRVLLRDMAGQFSKMRGEGPAEEK